MRVWVMTTALAVGGFGLAGCGAGDAATPPVVAVSSPSSLSSPSSPSPTLDVCALLSPAAVGAALGQDVEVSTQVLGCAFASGDARAPILSVTATGASQYASGFAEVEKSLAYVIHDGRVTRLPHLAGGGVMDVGTAAGATQVGAVGFVQVGRTMVQVNLRQLQDLSTGRVTTLMKASLAAVAGLQ